MGAWGYSAFDNDEAMDWLGRLLEAELPTSCWMLDLDLASRESWAAEQALAACEVVAALGGRAHAQATGELKEWAVDRGELLDLGLVRAALAVAAVIRDESELRELFKADPLWIAEVDGLLERLGAIDQAALPDRGEWVLQDPPSEEEPAEPQPRPSASSRYPEPISWGKLVLVMAVVGALSLGALYWLDKL